MHVRKCRLTYFSFQHIQAGTYNRRYRIHAQAKNIRSQAGPTIKQYGRFHLKRFEVYIDEREILTNKFVVELNNGDGSYEKLGMIEAEKSTLPDVLNHLHSWQHR